MIPSHSLHPKTTIFTNTLWATTEQVQVQVARVLDDATLSSSMAGRRRWGAEPGRRRWDAGRAEPRWSAADRHLPHLWLHPECIGPELPGTTSSAHEAGHPPDARLSLEWRRSAARFEEM
jgi:hypothetical protein